MGFNRESPAGWLLSFGSKGNQAAVLIRYGGFGMRKLVLLTVLIVSMALAATAFGQTAAKGEKKAVRAVMITPIVMLESFEVPQYDGWWYFAAKVEPTKGDKGDRGAPLPMSFLFTVKNPNKYPIALEGAKFTVAFDREFEVITYNNNDVMWIPAGKTNHFRATTMITARSALLSLLVTGGYKLKEKGWDAFGALERWWKGVPDYTVPVTVKEGAFTFTGKGMTKVIPFDATVK